MQLNHNIYMAHKRYSVQVRPWMLLGTLRSDNGDVHEKQTLHHFKLFCDYPNSSSYLKEGDLGWS